jgi:hypothetical protein
VSWRWCVGGRESDVAAAAVLAALCRSVPSSPRPHARPPSLPSARSFVCPTEIIAFSDRAKKFEALNCQVSWGGRGW